MDWKYLFTSFEGRIGRQSFWIGSVVLIAISIVADVLDLILGTQFNSGIGLFNAAAGIAMIYPSLALYAKRWHDRDKSGWWTLIALIPLIGIIWIVIELGCLRGTDGLNQYGRA